VRERASCPLVDFETRTLITGRVVAIPLNDLRSKVPRMAHGDRRSVDTMALGLRLTFMEVRPTISQGFRGTGRVSGIVAFEPAVGFQPALPHSCRHRDMVVSSGAAGAPFWCGAPPLSEK
jgi:hypothetical protein